MTGQFKVGEWTVIPELNRLERNGQSVRVERKVMQVLVLLAEKPGKVLSKEHIFRHVWPETFVSDEVLTRCISELRKVFEDNPKEPTYIQTIPKGGYRLLATVVAENDDPGHDQKGRHRLSAALAAGVLLLAGIGLYFFIGQRKSSAVHIGSLAVLPFTNLSGDANQEYFSDGITDEIITDLAHVGALSVISRTSAMQYKGTRKPLPQIARELNVDAIVEGSMVRTGGRIRIRAQLIDGRTDHHLWAETYERDLGDVINLQSEVARAIVDRIQAKLTPPEQARFSIRHGVDPQAYENYLKGRYFWAKFTAEGWRKGIEYFNRAIETDPSYARAYAGLADCYLRLGAYEVMPASDAMPKGEAAARKAIEIDDNLGEAHFALAFGKIFYDFDWSGADRELQLGLQLDPGNANGYMTYSVFLSALGQTQHAIEEQKRAVELDPLSLIINANLARAYYFADENDKAIEQCRKTLTMDPSFEPAHNWLIMAYWAKRMYRESVEEEQGAIRRAGKGELANELGQVYATRGYRGVLEWEVTTNLKAWRKGEEQASDVAMAYADLGKKDEAFLWLQNARKAHDASVVLVKVLKPYNSLRSDPRYLALLRDLHLPD